MRFLYCIFLISLLAASRALEAKIITLDPPELISLHGHIASVTNMTPPFFSSGYLIFPYRGTQKPRRFVGIAFDYEEYKNIYSFVKNKKGIYVFYGRIPYGVKKMSYRLIVDSVWQYDNSNPNTHTDKMGVRISTLNVDDSILNHENQRISPLILANGLTEFSFWGKAKMYAFVLGTFNQWDPFMTPMEEISPGYYKARLRLRPGRYYYNFLVDGKKLRDPNNFFQASGPGGEIVNVIDIELDDSSSQIINSSEKKGKP